MTEAEVDALPEPVRFLYWQAYCAAVVLGRSHSAAQATAVAVIETFNQQVQH